MKKNRYLAGEIAKIFGITIETVRYYHKIGLLAPSRNEENNYRYFDQSSVSNVHSVALMRSFGIPIEKIKAFYDTGDLKILSGQIEDNQKQIDEKILRLNQQKMELRRFQKQLKDVHDYSSEINIRQSPQWRTVCESDERDLAEMNRSFRNIMKDVDYLPSYAYLMSKESFLARERDYYRYCLLLEPECAHIPEEAGVIPSRKCAYFVFSEKEEKLTEAYARLYHWIQEHHYDVTGDTVERFILSTPRISVMELWVPIGE